MSIQPVQPPHNRKLGLIGISLTKARLNKNSGPALDAVREELEAVIIESEFLNGAPFSWVTLSIRYGIKSEEMPHFQPINRKFGDLPLAIEIETEQMQGKDVDDLKTLFRGTVLRALVAAGSRYNRPDAKLRSMLAATSSNPDQE